MRRGNERGGGERERETVNSKGESGLVFTLAEGGR